MIHFLIGFAAGIISGMGIGGGAIMIPALVFFLEIQQKTAQGINLIYFVPSAVVALIVHIVKKRINFKVWIYIVIGGAISAVIGSKLALSLENELLKKVFGGFLLIVGLYELFVKKPVDRK